ncbi:RnfABCDGE type electron transport complex subunit D [Vallitalea pronyensis]|uniref:Ion-translocating oxidoreductase complex subunit D n=1 Tax=Vallitalea pronyensis TaxID=1348613 RepID=A0A8J8SHD5_9FIRM|nr:RnfABCDGE type electron transport complex subunit D [Vallitalea pronyensis]QUI23324.1 RnfABCDGE type electron transport complex subunit D [Vallitalea pronyensis]
MTDQYIVSSSPHIRSNESVDRIMRHVVIALLPATVFGIYHFGIRAFIITLICIAACVGAESLYQFLTKRTVTIGDFSAVVTGLLLALNLPHTVPYWLPIVGGVVAIIIVKQLFGGLGQNFMNPALGARAFLLISFTGLMTRWEVDGISAATPLGMIKDGVTDLPSVANTFFGFIGGCIGETSVVALVLGGIYLIAKKIINWRIPVFYIGTVVILSILLGGRGLDMTYVGYQVFGGGLMIGAFYMATDYASSPITRTGQVIMGLGCGILTSVIRIYGGYPEGVSFAILIMNLFVPLIDRFTIPRVFGEVAKNEK